MNRVRQIAIALGLLFLLPAVLLTFRELRSLNEFEDTLGKAYDRQLDGTLFSVNQFSQDLAESWGRELDQSEEVGSDFFLNFPTVSQVFVFGEGEGQLPKQFGEGPQLTVQDAAAIFAQNKALIKRLNTYMRADYRKIEPLSPRPDLGIQLVLLLAQIPGVESPKACLLVLETNAYIKQNLAPRLSLVSQEDFNLIVFRDSLDPQIVHTTDTIQDPEFIGQKALWLLPDHHIAIGTRGQSLESILKARSQGSLALILGVGLLMLLGIIWVFLSMRKEMQLAQTKSDFVANVSHEIRTPLALISMFAETLMLKRVPSEERKDTYYRIMFQESKRLTGLVNKILNFSQMEMGNRVYNFAVKDLNTLAKEVWEAYDYHLTQHGFVTSLEVSDSPAWALVDHEAIGEALVNLLDNAMKYSLEQKSIVLRTGGNTREVWLEVIDKGIGIPTDQQSNIFEKFHRVAQGPVHNTKGTGLGLTLVQRIMDAHQGRVEVHSKVDKGSRFQLVFARENAPT